MVAFVFFRIVASVISLEHKKAGFSFIGWCMINTVSKNQSNFLNVERNIVYHPVWQRLGWPSSYVTTSSSLTSLSA